MDERIYFLTKDERGNEIYIRRDDLLPFSFGGNKEIIAKAQIDDMARKGRDIMIGYGNSRSNFCRVLTALCYSKNIPCKIISPLDDDDTFTPSFNNSLVKMTGAEIITCKKSEAKKTIDSVKKSCRNSGLKPYFVYDIKNIAAPVKAFSKDFSKIKTCFDDIFIATGTGITTSGIIAGMVKKSIKEGTIRTSLIGISVARSTEREMPVISSYVKTQGRAVSDFYEDNREKLFVLRDDFVGKGYGSIEEDVEKTVREIYLRFGIALDPTYTGKAFYGMKKYIEENGLRGKKILFWHTGGLPLFFDYFEQKR